MIGKNILQEMPRQNIGSVVFSIGQKTSHLYNPVFHNLN